MLMLSAIKALYFVKFSLLYALALMLRVCPRGADLRRGRDEMHFKVSRLRLVKGNVNKKILSGNCYKIDNCPNLSLNGYDINERAL